MLRRLIDSAGQLAARPWVRGGGLLLYYLAILLGLLLIYGRGDFTTPHFIYQGF
jgi:hypothetical protein